MAYNTGKPVPSRDPRDLIDNAESFDIRATSRDVRSTPDRLGISRKTWYGMEQDFAEFLAASGFEPAHLVYEDGVALQVDRPTQLIDYSGSVYRVKMPASFPVALSGTWAADSVKLVDVGDQSLREYLASSGGAELVGLGDETVASAIDHVEDVLSGGQEAARTIDTDLIIIYGQSNSVGWAQNTPGYPESVSAWARAYNPVSGQITAMPKALISSAGQTSTGHGWAEFGNRYAELGRKSVFVSCGYGGMSIAQLSKGTAHYSAMVSAVAGAKAALSAEGITPSKVIVIFNQGEQDAQIGTKKYAYKLALIKLISDMTADAGVQHFGIQTLGSPVGIYGTDLAQSLIRSGQYETANENAIAFVASLLSSKLRIENGLMQSADGVHYTQLGYNLVGRDSADNTFSVIKGRLSRSAAGVDRVGSVDLSSKYNWHRAFAQLNRAESGFELVSDPALGYVAVNAGSPVVAGSIVKYRVAANNYRFGGIAIEPNETSKRYNLSAVIRRNLYGPDPAEFGVEVVFCAELIFSVTSTGAIATVRNSAASNGLVSGNVDVTVAGTAVTVAAKSGVNFEGLPTVTSGGTVGGVSVGAATVVGFTLNFSDGATLAIVRIPVVGMLPNTLPAGCAFSITTDLSS